MAKNILIDVLLRAGKRVEQAADELKYAHTLICIDSGEEIVRWGDEDARLEYEADLALIADIDMVVKNLAINVIRAEVFRRLKMRRPCSRQHACQVCGSG